MWNVRLLSIDIHNRQNNTISLANIDQHINQNSPWLIKDKDRLKIILQEEIDMLRELARQIKPFIPETAGKILEQFKGPKITSQPPLFPRIEENN